MSANSIWDSIKLLTSAAVSEACDCASPVPMTTDPPASVSEPVRWQNEDDCDADATVAAVDPGIAKCLPRNLSHSNDSQDLSLYRMKFAWRKPPALPTAEDLPDGSSPLTSDSACFSVETCSSDNDLRKESLLLPIDTERSVAKANDSQATKAPGSPLYRDNDLEVYQPKRSSSLKSSRASPDSSSKKEVRFADAFGLDLTSVRQVFDLQNPPKIPNSATVDLNLDKNRDLAALGSKHFSLGFSQPGASLNFLSRVTSLRVCLENAQLDSRSGSLAGLIRVYSLGFEKRVFVRLSYNNWSTFCEMPATYVKESYDGLTDKFSFNLTLPSSIICGDVIQFAVCYQTQTGERFWDNNYGQNYKITCYAKQTFPSGESGSWFSYL